jgi:membrane protease YdiL (CAAX protease family)
MRRLDLGLTQVGLNLNRLPIQLLVGFSGIPLGIAEFYILRPKPLMDSLTWGQIALPAIILFVGTGFAEEIVFRGVMQCSTRDVLGQRNWIYIAGLFAALHIGYLSVADIGLVFVAGLFFGWVVGKTGSILGVTVSHGVANMVLYLIVPFLF